MCERIFNGREKIDFEEFNEFRNQVIESLWHYEFYQFERDGHDHISDYDMAVSLYTHYIPAQRLPEYMKHMEQYKDQKRGCCSVNQYCAFQYFMKGKATII